MTLHFHSDTAQETVINPNHLTRITSFVSDNVDDLIVVAGAAGGHNAAAAANDLVDMVLSGEAPADHLFDLLIFLRDAFMESPASASSFRAPGRPDLDAAVRWFGARLDDLIRPMA